MQLPRFIIEFFTSLNEQENESLKRTFEGDFSDVGGFTTLCQKFIDNDAVLINDILPLFINYLESDVNRKCLLNAKKDLVNNELIALYQKLESHPGPFYEYQIEHNEKLLSTLSMSSLRDSATSIFDEILSEIEAVKTTPNRLNSENYFYVSALGILYEKYKFDSAADNKYKKTNKEENKLYRYYKSLDIDIKKEDRQFNKYDLLSIDSSEQILVGLPSRVLDKENNAQFLVDIPERLLNIFKSLIDLSVIKQIAFLVESEVVFETSDQYFILLGNQESEKAVTLKEFLDDSRDKSATRQIIKHPERDDVFPAYTSAGRFIENNDSSWYFVDKSNIYLEEMVDDAEVLDDCVVTQLVHIEYYVESCKLYISHIDHEYIFYSYDEFDERQKDFSQKGSARKRIKTFKIDGSRIPLVTDDGVLPLNTILDCYFVKPYLLNGFIRELITTKLTSQSS